MELFKRELKHEVFRKSVYIPPNCLVERSYRHSIQLGQVHTQHHLHLSNIKNAPFDLGDGYDQIRVLHDEDLLKVCYIGSRLTRSAEQTHSAQTPPVVQSCGEVVGFEFMKEFMQRAGR